MTPLLALLVAIIVTALIILWMPRTLIWPWIRVIRTRTIDRFKDVTAQAIQPPAPVADAMRQLQGLGFGRVGESQTTLEKGVGMAWHMVSRDGTIMAEVVPYLEGYAAGLSTAFEDGSVVETGYRIGERFKTPTHVSDFTRTSLEAACDLHLANVETFTGRRTSPRIRLDSMEAVHAHEMHYREKHYRRKLLRPLMRGVWLMLFLLIPAGLAVYELWGINVALRTSPVSLAQVVGRAGPRLLVGGLSLVAFWLMYLDFQRHAGK